MPYYIQNSCAPGDEAEDRPFRMTEIPLNDINESRDMAEALQILSQGGSQTPSQRNRFFAGICLALPLSALLWYLVYHFLHILAE
jgi:hypothetical protein